MYLPERLTDMKKMLFLLLAAAIILSLNSCLRFKDDEMPTFSGSFTGKVTDISGNSLLLVPWSTEGDKVAENGLYIAFTDSADEISAGSIVNVGYSGLTLETYPAQLAGVKIVEVVGRSDNITGLYVKLFSDLWDEDTSLNDGVAMLAFDLSHCSNLTEGEKSAVMYLCGLKLGVNDVFAGTLEELIQNGLVDRDRLYFETGVLFTVEDTIFEEGSFSFSAEKWRGDLKSSSYNGCRAQLVDSEWVYSR